MAEKFLGACVKGDLEVLRDLVGAEYREVADIHTDAEYGFRLACQKGNLEVIKWLSTSQELLDQGHSFVNIHDFWCDGFQKACMEGRLEVVRFLTTSEELVEAGHTLVDLQEWGVQGFTTACVNGHLEVAQFLIASGDLKNRVNPKEAKNVLYLCSSMEQWNIIRWLIFDCNIEGNVEIEERYGDPGDLVKSWFEIRESRHDLRMSLEEGEKINAAVQQPSLRL